MFVSCLFILDETGGQTSRLEDKTKCPQVKAIKNFNIDDILGSWYVVMYYASSEEELTYKCMRAVFSMSPTNMEVMMNFTYSFTDDPDHEQLLGNITWVIPNPEQPSHWVHAEDSYEGVYNTYILDVEFNAWSLLLHCAEKSKSPRYLSSFIMSRKSDLSANAIHYLMDKLPKYDIDLEYMFPMIQRGCGGAEKKLHYAQPKKKPFHHGKRHPMKQIHH